RRTQEQHIIGIDHGGVGRFAMCLPDRAVVKILERLRARRHVTKISQPDKSVWIIQVPELTDDLHPERFLRFDKFPVEQIDQHIPLPWMQRVLPQLNNWTASLRLLGVRSFHARNFAPRMESSPSGISTRTRPTFDFWVSKHIRLEHRIASAQR